MTLPQQILAGEVQQVVRRRLDRLPQRVRAWLRRVAVAGRQLDLAVIDAMSGADFAQHRDDYLLPCASAAVLEVVDGVWRFSHDKIRETLLADLGVDERGRLHGEVARAIEAIHAGDAAYHELLLEHWHEAGDLDKALQYLVPVAEFLISYNADYARAQFLVSRGLAALPPEDGRRVPLLNQYGLAYRFTGQMNESNDFHAQALALARQIGDQKGIAESLYWQASQAMDQSRFAEAESCLREGLPIAEAAGDTKGVARSLNGLGWLAMIAHDYRTAEDYLRQAMAQNLAMGDQRGVSSCLFHLGLVFTYQHEYDKAEDCHQQSLVIDRAGGDLLGIAMNLESLGILEDDFGRKRYASALSYYRQALALLKQMGDLWDLANTLTNLGFLYLRMGDDGQAVPTLREALSLSVTVGRRESMVEAITAFALLALRRGEVVRAAALAGLVRNHPDADPDANPVRLGAVLPGLEEKLSANALEEALKRGEALDLDTVAAALLAEYGE